VVDHGGCAALGTESYRDEPEPQAIIT